VQDVRGRYTSEGEWYPFKHETEDGFDTVEWAAALPHSNGKVGMFGGSYVGATQMLAAIGHPPHLAGICPVVTASNYHENWTYQGGAFEQWFNESWTSSLAQDTLDRLSDVAQPSCALSMFGFEIADSRCRNRVARLQLRDDNVLLWMMARIRIVLEIVDDREDDLVIRSIAAIEHTQLPFQHTKQLFDVAMFLT